MTQGLKVDCGNKLGKTIIFAKSHAYAEKIFEFLRMNRGKEGHLIGSLSEALFHLKFQICFKLQDLVYQTEKLIAFRKSLVDELEWKVRELNHDNFVA